MTDPSLQQANGQDALDEKLNHISKKQGVKAAIVLDRTTGAILRTSGQLSTINSAASALAAQTGGGSFSGDGVAGTPGAQQQQQQQEHQQQQQQNNEAQGLEEFARKVWNYVNVSATLVQDLDTEDELKLLRLRTKKQELVIVPDAKYLMIVVHDTPTA